MTQLTTTYSLTGRTGSLQVFATLLVIAFLFPLGPPEDPDLSSVPTKFHGLGEVFRKKCTLYHLIDPKIVTSTCYPAIQSAVQVIPT